MSVATTLRSEAAALRLPTHRDPYYAGKWQKGSRYVEVTNPATGESLGKVTDGTMADAEAAIAAAKAAFHEWRRVPPPERAKMLREIANVQRKNGDELAMVRGAECGHHGARAGAPVGAAACRADRWHLAAGRVERRAGRPRSRPGSLQPSGRCDDRADRQRADRARRDESGVRYTQAGVAGARRQERPDRVSGRRSRGGLGRGRRRHEPHLVRPVLRLDPPGLHPWE